MGVYIKEMKMPKGCYDPLVTPSYCFLLRSGTCKICHEYADKHGELCMEYPQGCPLVEVKEPHGRLIDAEYLEEHLYQCETNGRPLHIIELNERLACITDVPTAIEAEGEWIEVDDSLISCKCSICGWESHMHEDDVYGMPYCPNCGTDMRIVESKKVCGNCAFVDNDPNLYPCRYCAKENRIYWRAK